MDAFGPDAFATLQRAIRDEVPDPTLRLALATLRLSAWDADVFAKFRDVIIDRTPAAPDRLQADIYRDVARVYERFFPLTPERDVAFDCARVCMGLRRYAEAIALFLASMRLAGEHHVTIYNIGICCFHTERFAAARAAFLRSLALNAAYKDAALWLARAEAKLAPPPPPEGDGAPQPAHAHTHAHGAPAHAHTHAHGP